jgi:hypothetical protein
LVVAGEAHLHRILTSLAAAVLISIYGELIRRAFVIGKRFSSPVSACLASPRKPRAIASTRVSF